MLRPLFATLIVLVVLAAETKAGCPWCPTGGQTLTEEMNTMDTAVLAKLVTAYQAKGADGDPADTLIKAKFEIIEVLKGKQHFTTTRTIETIYFGTAKVGNVFLIMGIDPPRVMWSSPLLVNESAQKYLRSLLAVPKSGAARLKFFQQYLEHKDEMLAQDAYDEFAKASYATVKQLKPDMQHARLIQWLENRDIPASRRRLHFTMLGVCGSTKDLPLLASMMRSEDLTRKRGLDAMIACYLTLAGSDGLPLVEELFLSNKDAEYTDTYASIMAIRFHGDQDNIIPRKRLAKSLSCVLQRPQIADLVIPDLAKWEDWSHLDQMVKLFKKSDEKSSWVRVPVVNYVRACPLPSAKKMLAELNKIDPEAVTRAKTFFPLKPTVNAAAVKKNDAKRPR